VHTSGINSFAIVHEGAISASGLDVFIDLLRANFGAALLRVKGVVRFADDESRPVVIHGVQHIFHPPARLPAWPNEEKTTRIVFITRGDVREEIGKLFAAVSDPLTGMGAAAADDSLSLLPDGDG
jgi:G3E family GTPase